MQLTAQLTAKLASSSLPQGGSNSPLLNRMVQVQLVLFAILYAVWILPETIFIRHVCLIVGAVLGLYEIIHFRALLVKKSALPVWLLLGLFAWAIFHLLFLSSNFELQLHEFKTIWKRTALGAIFALGLGLALARVGTQKLKAYWPLLYLGLMMPTLIYILKYILTHHGQVWALYIPEYLRLQGGASIFYIAKTSYVCFCLPTLAVALGQLHLNIRNHIWLSWSNAVYVLSIPAIFFVFYGENIKNGVIYGTLLLVIFTTLLLLSNFKQHWKKKVLFISTALVLVAMFLVNHVQKNESWKTLVADAHIALDTDSYDHWKLSGAKGYPNNELGKIVSVTNYERMAWGKIALSLVPDNPLGYGLIEESFGKLTKQKWPESSLRQSHSGWLDFALGMGIPGLTLVWAAILGAYMLMGRGSHGAMTPWVNACQWILFASYMMWFTTEISQRVFFDVLILWIAFSAGLAAALSSEMVLNSVPQSAP
jgi:hypothetical protein